MDWGNNIFMLVVVRVVKHKMVMERDVEDVEAVCREKVCVWSCVGMALRPRPAALHGFRKT